ncbi:hypothetical protein C6N75_05265 [Streptomyces solincola]|uniref:Metallo-beta-lactamase domain-containing protein n=1 Tax=Streptomyces solincola TaxID=2100817 RepID=A0A2S9Q0W3_9ACTN|nr:hypothetical protein C6N75_05265 [Streptomyces solincola]
MSRTEPAEGEAPDGPACRIRADQPATTWSGGTPGALSAAQPSRAFCRPPRAERPLSPRSAALPAADRATPDDGISKSGNTPELDREDVGQGDALVIAAGDGQGVVVDAGPDPRLVDDCLTELGVSRIPLVVLTHFHADHVRGLPGVLDGRQVAAVQTTGLQEPPEQAEFVRRTVAAARIPVLRAVAGERRRIGPLDWQVLWPPPPPPPPPPVVWPLVSMPLPLPLPPEPNDASVTMLVRAAGGVSLLLLGDLEPPAQQALLRAHPDLPAVDVLKVAHHGSARQDAELLERVRPRLALVSAGRDNSYGHPAPRTVAALDDGGAAVLSTAEHGAIAVTAGEHGLRAVPRGPPTAP